MNPLIGSHRVLGYLFFSSNKSGYGFSIFLCPQNIEPLDARDAAASKLKRKVLSVNNSIVNLLYIKETSNRYQAGFRLFSPPPKHRTESPKMLGAQQLLIHIDSDFL